MTNDGNHTYVYDAENRLISVDGGTPKQPAAATTASPAMHGREGQAVSLVAKVIL